MVKITNKEMLNVNASLVYLSQKETAAWYQVSKNIRILKPFLAEWEESHKSIIEKLADKGEDGKVAVNDKGQVSFGDNIEKANESYESLLKEEVEIPFFTFSYSKLEDSKLDGLQVEQNH
jgi:hypothetical protein